MCQIIACSLINQFINVGLHTSKDLMLQLNRDPWKIVFYVKTC
jgi:hypothetical protein